MDPQKVQLRLGHILQEIDVIIAQTGAVGDDELGMDVRLIKMVERCIEIISEATRHVPVELRDMEPEIAWRKIIHIGNLLRHEYYRIDHADMIRIARVHVPALRPAIIRLLAHVGKDT